ncbi:MAG: hypothetical protein KAS75_01110 [Planctomycetes bacterium]|nr:hypothetical protein [Planctomycetota bacterium]
MKDTAKILVVLAVVLACSKIFAISPNNNFGKNLPALNLKISPLDEGNRSALFKRIVATFNQKYEKHRIKNANKTLAEKFAVYYLRQELQALIDIWHATDNIAYLEKARERVFKAISDAEAKPKPLFWHNQLRGNWPCFFSKDLEKITGGHGQLWDLQGSAGFMLVANALHQANRPGWDKIADFVEKNIVEKWLHYRPGVKTEIYHGDKTNMYLLVALNGARDKREHFATICMNLHELGYNKYPYKKWAKLLVNLYIGTRTNMDAMPANASEIGKYVPKDWGVIRNQQTNGWIWYWTSRIIIQDTSHANRTAWFAAKSYSQNLVDRKKLDGFINTLKHQVWAPDKAPFHFNNFLDGRDEYIRRMGPGRRGNVWFGWHRLAAYDDTLKNLFISIAYDLTNGGPNITKNTQNFSMENAQPCLLAWAARLLSPTGQPQMFP